jgi:hypothetical protein
MVITGYYWLLIDNMALTMDTGIIVFFPVFCLTGAKKKGF